MEDIEKGDVVSASFMSAEELKKFLLKTIEEAKQKGILWSIHLKATMMKVSDPIIFGHAVEAYFKDIFEKYKDEFEKKGLIFSALSPDGLLPEIIELNNHPWFVGVQFHPESIKTTIGIKILKNFIN